MSASEELQKVLKTLSDPTRMRILRLLEEEELVVQELMSVLGMAQSRVSRHLAILREAGLLIDRRDGTYVSYRFVPPSDGPWSEGWQLIKRHLDDDPSTDRDRAMLRQVLEARRERTRSFFDAIGPEWDALRKVFGDETLRAQALARLVPPGLRVADVGTGTGILACEMARMGLEVVGIDHSARMLDAARTKLEEELRREPFALGGSVEFRAGEADRMPLADDEMDAALAHMVLHYMPAPQDVIGEMARIVRPGGTVVMVDFEEHEYEWMRQELGVLWMGFSLDQVRDFCATAGLAAPLISRSDPQPRGRDLPATLIASVRVP